ncbi:MAG: tRNA (N(6)-L-threonylcarbamoyladenosine(37)-C(2))-methylthiotransferase MtaB [Epsilonproteobacteria bacterium]|nr:tRNA (N(6)-L-threonylcarbamoyladenosine(37)-C(2))-methylthiotransferase MtaB [Campylobacterota bacterium]
MKKVYFKTFGCRTNQFDTQIMISKLRDFELTMSEDSADLIVVNSCTVTNGADSSVRGYINRINKKKPDIRVILAGCGAHSKGEKLLAEKRVFGVFGHSEKENIESILKLDKPFYKIGDLNHIDTTIVEQFIGKSRAFIKIQEGCNFDCSYCIIPSVRGRARSHSEESILTQVEKLASNGFGEFILTGTNVGSYGYDIGSSIAKLIKKISQIRGVRRVRVGSLEPIQIDDEFKELLKEPFMAKHLHIALQHTSDKMLEIMSRRNRFHYDRILLEEISSLGFAIGTDFIVGHPMEDDSCWSEAMDRVRELPLTHIHAFTYSKRDNTKSAGMRGEVRGDVAKQRYRELISTIRGKHIKFLESHNRALEVLIEKRDGSRYSGYDQYFNRVEIESDIDILNSWVEIEKATREGAINVAIFK